MFDVRFIWFLIALILGSYAVLIVLSQVEPFKEFCEKGGFHPFENVLVVCALFAMVMGVWVNGYREGKKDVSS